MGKSHRRQDTSQHGPRQAKLPFVVTNTAVNAFRDLCAAGLPWEHAPRELKVLAASAKRTESRTNAGQSIWLATNGQALRFVVKDAPDGLRLCVTVLAPTKVGESVVPPGLEDGARGAA